MTARLITPYCGYTAIELIEKQCFGWLVKIIGSGKLITVYDDEFEID